MSQGTKNQPARNSGRSQSPSAYAAALSSGQSYSDRSHQAEDHFGVAQSPQNYAGGATDDYAPRQPSTKTRPVHEIRLGRVVAAIWENRTEQGDVRHNVTIAKIYKQDEQWRETQSFGRDELPLAMKVLDQCHTWIFAQRQQRANQPADR
jgi:hypothetical protein